MEEMRRLLEELERENRRLKETEGKQNLGRDVLEYLRTGCPANDKVIKALERVQKEIYNFESGFNIERQRRNISRVEYLRDKISKNETARNVLGGIGIASGVMQLCFLACPVAFVIQGVGTAAFLMLSADARKEIEDFMQEVQRILNADAERFRLLTKAVEELDKVWEEEFCFSIHSEKFRKICQQSVEIGSSHDNRLRRVLMWFGLNEKWATINIGITSYYFLSTINIIGGISSSQVAVGLNIACNLFLLLNDLSKDASRSEIVDQGIERMKEQYKVMLDLI